MGPSPRDNLLIKKTETWRTEYDRAGAPGVVRDGVGRSRRDWADRPPIRGGRSYSNSRSIGASYPKVSVQAAR